MKPRRLTTGQGSRRQQIDAKEQKQLIFLSMCFFTDFPVVLQTMNQI